MLLLSITSLVMNIACFGTIQQCKPEDLKVKFENPASRNDFIMYRKVWRHVRGCVQPINPKFDTIAAVVYAIDALVSQIQMH